MRNIFVGMASVLLFLGIVGLAIAATSQEVTRSASATVNAYVSITLTDAGASGINFGSLDPGISNVNDTNQNSTTPAIRVTNDAVSNTNIKVNAKGTDFSDGVNSFVIGNMTYDDDNLASQGAETGKTESLMSNSYPGADYYSGIAPGGNADFWFFLDIPSGQKAGSYTSTVTFKGVA